MALGCHEAVSEVSVPFLRTRGRHHCPSSSLEVGDPGGKRATLQVRKATFGLDDSTPFCSCRLPLVVPALDLSMTEPVIARAAARDWTGPVAYTSV